MTNEGIRRWILVAKGWSDARCIFVDPCITRCSRGNHAQYRQSRAAWCLYDDWELAQWSDVVGDYMYYSTPGEESQIILHEYLKDSEMTAQEHRFVVGPAGQPGRTSVESCPWQAYAGDEQAADCGSPPATP